MRQRRARPATGRSSAAPRSRRACCAARAASSACASGPAIITIPGPPPYGRSSIGAVVVGREVARIPRREAPQPALAGAAGDAEARRVLDHLREQRHDVDAHRGSARRGSVVGRPVDVDAPRGDVHGVDVGRHPGDQPLAGRRRPRTRRIGCAPLSMTSATVPSSTPSRLTHGEAFEVGPVQLVVGQRGQRGPVDARRRRRAARAPGRGRRCPASAATSAPPWARDVDHVGGAPSRRLRAAAATTCECARAPRDLRTAARPAPCRARRRPRSRGP